MGVETHPLVFMKNRREIERLEELKLRLQEAEFMAYSLNAQFRIKRKIEKIEDDIKALEKGDK